MSPKRSPGRQMSPFRPEHCPAGSAAWRSLSPVRRRESVRRRQLLSPQAATRWVTASVARTGSSKSLKPVGRTPGPGWPTCRTRRDRGPRRHGRRRAGGSGRPVNDPNAMTLTSPTTENQASINLVRIIKDRRDGVRTRSYQMPFLPVRAVGRRCRGLRTSQPNRYCDYSTPLTVKRC
jgi:hypothetical protein